MSKGYDKYYQTENLFGAPYPELIAFFTGLNQRGRLLDLGCGQGRDAIPLARLGYEVTGIDHSSVGIEQMNQMAYREHLPLTGIVADIYEYTAFDRYDYILLDSLFHFGTKERTKEVGLLTRILEAAQPATYITICIQDVGRKVEILNTVLSRFEELELVDKTSLVYEFRDQASNHTSDTKYEMRTVRKQA
jgi:SAM-dependent methyltransferase